MVPVTSARRRAARATPRGDAFSRLKSEDGHSMAYVFADAGRCAGTVRGALLLSRAARRSSRIRRPARPAPTSAAGSARLRPGADVERVVSQGEMVAPPLDALPRGEGGRDLRGRRRDRARPRQLSLERSVKTIVYLHGFISSPAIEEGGDAGRLPAQLRAAASTTSCPSCTIARRGDRAGRARRARGVAPGDLTLVGSSLGGFYATVMAERLGCRAALLNPAVHPHTHFAQATSAPQKNLYTGEAFELTRGARRRAARRWTWPRSRARSATGSSSRPATRCSTIARPSPSTPAPSRRSCAAATMRSVSFPEHVPDLVEWAASR